MKNAILKLLVIPFLAGVFAHPHLAHAGLLSDVVHEVQAKTAAAPAGAEMEVAFSPDGGGEALVLKVINSSRRDLRILGYSFTSAPIVNALLSAKSRGVDIALAVDEEENTVKDRSGKARHALSALVNAGIPVRLVSAFAIMHDKVIVADGRHVETGSFNYTDAAARRNSENVLVSWNNPALAEIYLKHWQSRFAMGQPFRTRY